MDRTSCFEDEFVAVTVSDHYAVLLFGLFFSSVGKLQPSQVGDWMPDSRQTGDSLSFIAFLDLDDAGERTNVGIPLDWCAWNVLVNCLPPV